MKKIKTQLMHAFFWLCISILQGSSLSAENLNDNLSQKDIEKTIDSIILLLNREYIFPKKALLVEQELRRKLANKYFEKADDWYSLTKMLNTAMKNASGDMHLDIVEVAPMLTRRNPNKKSPPSINDRYGIGDVNILSGNVGYLQVNNFYQNLNAENEISRALEELSNVDALIIDLRNAEGNSITLAQYLMSFFVQEQAILSEIIYDKQNKRKVLIASNNHGNDKFKHDFPLYILTSAFLSNSGEFLSYTLKHLEKAVIVGEETMGIAYVLQEHKINHYISITIPIAIPVHPKTTTNWSGIGVIPDLHTEASLSLDAAHQLAKEHLGVF